MFRLIESLFYVVIFTLLFQRLTRRRTARKIAVSMKADLAKAYAPRHEFREVSPTEVPGLDLKFYDSAQRTLEQAGFRKLGDKEDLSLSAVFPQTRTFLRVMTTGDGYTAAHIYHGKIRGWHRLAALLFGVKEERVVDLETWLGDDRFLCTSSCRSATSLKHPPEISCVFRPDLDLEPLLALHRARLQEALQAGAVPIPVTTLQKAFDFSNAMQAVKSRFLASRGGVLDEEEIGAILRGKQKALVGEVVSESKRLP